ncbi:hypothetical protein HY989_01955 [Candidatus Micrarchaeota archaeon]|nr:hypothetical protein [Candidatus Micrarchaeota archaeon]
MANVTLYIPDDLKKRMSRHKDIRWSRAIRTIIESELSDFEEAEKLAQGSNLTQEDVDFLTEKVNEDIRKHVRALKNEIGR